MSVKPQENNSSTASAAGPPAHEVIYRKLRETILFGEIAPGEAVTIQGLCTLLEAGMTPVREALRRLIAEGALRFQGNRRVIVPTLSVANVDEIIFARHWLESHMAERASLRATTALWQELADIDAHIDAAIRRGDLHAYLRHNYMFHKKIYVMADTPILLDLADGLWLRFGPSLRVMIVRSGTQSLPDKHKDLLDCMRRGDAEGAARAMREDMLQGMDQIRRLVSTADEGG